MNFRIISLLFLLFVFAASYFYLDQENGEEIPVQNPKEDNAISLKKEVVDELCVRRGWPRADAEKLVNFHIYNWFNLQARLSRETLNKDLSLIYENLNNENPNFARIARNFLKDHPETLGLMLMHSNPEEFANAFRGYSKEDKQKLINSFVNFVTDKDIIPWTNAIKRHGKQIIDLSGRGHIIESISLFLYPRFSSPASEEYGLWLNDCLDEYLTWPPFDSERVLEGFLGFVMGFGERIRAQLKSKEIRDAFRARLWPAYERVVHEEERTTNSYEYTAYYSPHVWKLLARPNGKNFYRWADCLAVDCLEGPDAFEDRRVAKAFEQAILLKGSDDSLLRAFIRFMSEDKEARQFQELLVAYYSDTRFDDLIAEIMREPSKIEYFHRLHRRDAASLWSEITENIGAEEHIPGFAVYYAVKKGIQGRDVSGLELGFAVLEGGLTLFTLGSGSLLSQGIKAGGKTVAQQGSKIASKQISRKGGKEFLESASKQILKSAGRGLKKEAVDSSG